jgi:hypothetical protein
VRRKNQEFVKSDDKTWAESIGVDAVRVPIAPSIAA